MTKRHLKPEEMTPSTSTSVSASAITTTATTTTTSTSSSENIMMMKTKIEMLQKDCPLIALTIFLTEYALHPEKMP
jgi:BRCT domain type II-containing protein